MSLEKKIGDKGNIFSKFKRKMMPYVLAAGLGLGMAGCWYEAPGPISVQNEITPSTINSGDNTYWTIKVTNYGGKVTIDEVNVYEKVISGWATGQSDFADLLIFDDEISAHSTETIFSGYARVYNIPPYDDISDVTLKNIVTVYSNGGDDSDTCFYTIRSIYNLSIKQLEGESKKEFSHADAGIVRGLSDSGK
ncbi:MAG: hypothetical protein NTW06_00885 [Candidatus Falkowbacteria bacterium]|nr:hypothetical protein [Candidatus Falkowbacteria bacterium]